MYVCFLLLGNCMFSTWKNSQFPTWGIVYFRHRENDPFRHAVLPNPRCPVPVDRCDSRMHNLGKCSCKHISDQVRSWRRRRLGTCLVCSGNCTICSSDMCGLPGRSPIPAATRFENAFLPRAHACERGVSIT